MNGFTSFIVSGGGIEFMRPWTQKVYGIPPEQVVGSSIKTKFEVHDGEPVLVRLPELNFMDDKEGRLEWARQTDNRLTSNGGHLTIAQVIYGKTGRTATGQTRGNS